MSRLSLLLAFIGLASGLHTNLQYGVHMLSLAKHMKYTITPTLTDGVVRFMQYQNIKTET